MIFFFVRKILDIFFVRKIQFFPDIIEFLRLKKAIKEREKNREKKRDNKARIGIVDFFPQKSLILTRKF